MRGSKAIFDTNAFTAWASEDRKLAQLTMTIVEPAVSLITVGELVFGAKNSARPEKSFQLLNQQLLDFEVILPNRETANIYGDLCATLKRLGRPIPDNDVWIAATALQHGLAVISKDAHFDEIDVLERISW